MLDSVKDFLCSFAQENLKNEPQKLRQTWELPSSIPKSQTELCFLSSDAYCLFDRLISILCKTCILSSASSVQVQACQSTLSSMGPLS